MPEDLGDEGSGQREQRALYCHVGGLAKRRRRHRGDRDGKDGPGHEQPAISGIAPDRPVGLLRSRRGLQIPDDVGLEFVDGHRRGVAGLIVECLRY